ncbi:MAG: aminotransferase class I/II-fold pyridoxal phosphate-dependent enzyme [Candidatus Omnitrophota bacterium]|nr:aminotransferase class I/II-fold pyridoxal phosphate-dependent enzyme [Candidatus Omnitrophota bacterium]
MQEANRLKRLPQYLFTIMDNLKQEAAAKGKDVIDLGMGNPDLPSPPNVVEALVKAAVKPENHRYPKPTDDVSKRFRRAIAQWYDQRFGVKLDPDTEVLPLIGSKEGISHLALAFLNNDDIGMVTSPTYPVHANGIIMAGGILYNIPIGPENNFRPDFQTLPKEVVRMAKLLIVSYPHNPTAACVDLDFYNELVAWGKGKDTILCSDLAYSDIVFDGYKAPSLLQAKGARDRDAYCVEFHTCSKSYNMAGWRIGWAVGHPEILRSLAKAKSYIDFGIFPAVQEAAIEALIGPQDYVHNLVQIYKRRRDMFVPGLHALGWNVPTPKATFYIWAHIPQKFSGLTSLDFSKLLVNEAGIVTAPGTGFGEYGEGFVRFALVEPEERLKVALERLKKVLALKG